MGEQRLDIFEAARRQLDHFQPGGTVHGGLSRMLDARKELDMMLSYPTVSLSQVCRRCAELLGIPAGDSPSSAFSSLIALCESTPEGPWATPRERLQRLLDRVNPDLYPVSHGAGVTVTTVEDARGHEWRVVFFMDADMPDAGRSGHEEQRIRYLAFTRGAERVYYVGLLYRSDSLGRGPWMVIPVLERGPNRQDTDSGPRAQG